MLLRVTTLKGTATSFMTAKPYCRLLFSTLRSSRERGRPSLALLPFTQGATTTARRNAAVSTIGGSSSSRPLMLGCVAYDPAVGEIWSGMQNYLVQRGILFDYVLFTNYEAQIRALTQPCGGGIDVAWNGPVAHVRCEQLALQPTLLPDNVVDNHPLAGTLVSLGMRDVDRDFQSVVLVHNDSNVQALLDLNGTHVVTGASDSPQAHIVPLYALQHLHGIQFGKVTPFDVDMGKHGDTAVGEIHAMQSLKAGGPEGARVAVVSRMMWERACRNAIPGLEGIQEECSVLESVSLPVFDHCQFDAILTDNNREQLNDFGQALLDMGMERSDEEARLMKLEGIRKEWLPPRQDGYNVVRSALGVAANHRPATNFAYTPKRSFSTLNDPRSFGQRRFATSSAKPPRSVAVVGAGVAGLQAIRALKGHGFNVTAFEASHSVGGLWKSNYQNFGVQVPKQLYEFQDFPMESVAWGEYASGPQVESYVEQYANSFGLRQSIVFNTKVTSVQQAKKGDAITWAVETKKSDGAIQSEEFDYLVVATGLYSTLNKIIPTIPGQDDFSGTIVHSCDFTDASVTVDGKHVVVVGGGKSAVDCAVESSRSAASVTLLQRTPHWPTPRKIAGLIPFQYIFLSRFGTALVSCHRGTFPGGSGPVVNTFRNSGIVPLLMRPVFGTVEALFAF
jgi:ABC-type phosphate/phosphonate transport system substrate-binding protein/NADPH-dependent 2,4-dienoyl-CoA reductase/sulfur reductase-like enzyme